MSTTISEIQALVGARHLLCVSDLLSRRRARWVARPRQLAMWLSRHLTPCSLPEIGHAFDRDHTTVMHGIARTDARMADPAFREAALAMMDELSPEAGAEFRALRTAA
jgi:chromosomal replication initiation ATPase DnaA